MTRQDCDGFTSRGVQRNSWKLLVAFALVMVVMLLMQGTSTEPSADSELWKVKTVHDGDTVTCVKPNGTIQKIRLSGIDAPELNQRFGQRSTERLKHLLGGDLVRVERKGFDQYGRLLATLFRKSQNINLDMVKEGWAWVYDGFSSSSELLDAEATARKARRGLWADPLPLSPARWRQEHPRKEGSLRNRIHCGLTAATFRLGVCGLLFKNCVVCREAPNTSAFV